MRRVIRKALPGADEVVSYQIAACKLHGTAVIYFAGWKRHYSLYPATGLVATTLAKQLAPYKVSKGTIQFPLSEPVPVGLIERIAKLRAKDVAQQAEAKVKRARPKARGRQAGGRTTRR